VSPSPRRCLLILAIALLPGLSPAQDDSYEADLREAQHNLLKGRHTRAREAFESMIAAGDFIEHANVYGNYYGTSRRWIEAELAGGHDVLLEIDWQGARQVRALFPNMVGIFILPPSLEELRRRLTARGKDSAEVIARRMASAREEISHVLEFEYIIVNEQFDVAVADLQAVVRAARLSRERRADRLARLLGEFR